MRRLLNFILFLEARLLPVRLLDGFFNLSLFASSLAIKSLARMDPALLEYLSEKKALSVFKKARKCVPAYQLFLQDHRIADREIKSVGDYLRLVPQTTKENYVKKYSLTDRCVGGRLPQIGSLDESSGTSGTPTNWIRSLKEETAYWSITKSTMRYLYNCCPKRRIVLLNGFMQGAWAGGQRFASSMGPFGIIKNIGTDTRKIIQTMQVLGPDDDYLIGGYPPFLRDLVDAGNKTEGFNWKMFTVHILTAGEGFVEGWRDYMRAELKEGAKIFSFYGAIDLEPTISTENPLSIEIKKLLNGDPNFRVALLSTSRTPCFLGQYYPLHFHVQDSVNEQGVRELETTVLNAKLASPKIKYNVGDEGGVIPFERMRDVLKHCGYGISALAGLEPKFPIVPLPFLYVFGRSDGTVSIDGSNIYPSDISEAIHSDSELAMKINSFKLSTETDSNQFIRLFIHLEMRNGVEMTDSLNIKAMDVILAGLLRANECFRHAYEKNGEARRPAIVLVPFRTGIFKEAGNRIKIEYLRK